MSIWCGGKLKNMGNQIFLTKIGLEKLREDLKNLKTVRRREVAEQLQAAKEQGDLSENAEYVEAKEEQNRLEEKIAQLEIIVKNAQVIDNNGKKTGVVYVGSIVTLKTGDSEIKYSIVGSREANPAQGKISNESPLGKLIIGKKQEDKVILQVPNGQITYKIIKVE